MHGSQRGASQHLTEGEESSRGGGGVGGSSWYLALPQTLPGWGGIGGVWDASTSSSHRLGWVLEGVGGERPLPLPLQVDRPLGPGHIIVNAWA